jgi:hypothetical protein
MRATVSTSRACTRNTGFLFRFVHMTEDTADPRQYVLLSALLGFWVFFSCE